MPYPTMPFEIEWFSKDSLQIFLDSNDVCANGLYGNNISVEFFATDNMPYVRIEATLPDPIVGFGAEFEVRIPPDQLSLNRIDFSRLRSDEQFLVTTVMAAIDDYRTNTLPELDRQMLRNEEI